MSGKIDITGLSKAKVLMALYDAAKPQGLGFLHYKAEPMTFEEATALLNQGSYFDYVKGRVMKVDLKGDEFDSWGYDRDNGENAAEVVIETLRNHFKPNNPVTETIHKVNTFHSAINTAAQIGSETTIQKNGQEAVVNLGIGEFKEILEPKIEKAKKVARKGSTVLNKLIILPNEKEIIRRLNTVDLGINQYIKNFYPTIAEQMANRELLAPGVVLGLALAINDFASKKAYPSLIETTADGYLSKFIEVIVDDEDIVSEAKKLLDEAIAPKN